MMDETDLVFARPHLDSEGIITSRFPPEDKEDIFKCWRIILKDQLLFIDLRLSFGLNRSQHFLSSMANNAPSRGWDLGGAEFEYE